MNIKEKIKVMQHYENGGEVEVSEDDFKVVLCEANKKDDGDLCWDWDTLKYRIKEPKQKVTIEKWLVKNSYNEYFVIEAESKYLPYNKKVKLLESYEVEITEE